VSNKIIQADYWDRKIDIEVPEETVIGEIPNPPVLQDPEKAIREAIAKPIGAPPLAELAKKARNGKSLSVLTTLRGPGSQGR